MGKDLFLIDTGCNLNESIPKLFKDNGYDVKVMNNVRKVLRYDGSIILKQTKNKLIFSQYILDYVLFPWCTR